MNDVLGVIKLLKRFGIFVYTGNRFDDLDLMRSEIKDLFDAGLLPQEDYLNAVLILRSEASRMGN